jgi:hypothetical protein
VRHGGRSLVAAGGVVVLLLVVTAVVLGVHASGVQDRATREALARAARQHAQLAAARERTLDAAHVTYLELVDLRSALDGIPDPATQTAAERSGEAAFWSQARQQSVRRLTGVGPTFDADLRTADPPWPALDRAGQASLVEITSAQGYLGELYAGPPDPQRWLDRAAMRSAVERDVRALVVAMVPVCVDAQPLDDALATDCYDIQVDLSRTG